MAYKRLQKSSGSLNTIAQPRERQVSSTRLGYSDNATSSPGFETLNSHSKRLRNQPAGNSVTGSRSQLVNQAEISPALPQPKRNRVSLHPSSFHVPSIPSLEPQAEIEFEGLETDVDIQNRENADALNEIIMAVDMRERGTLGCAYYIAREEKLCLMEDIKMGTLDVVDTLKLHAQPTVLLISSKADEELEDHLNKEARPANRDDNNSIFGSYVLESRPSTEFQFETAKIKLANLEIESLRGSPISFVTPSDPILGDVRGQDHYENGAGRHGRLMRLAGQINLDSRLTIGCSGAILSYLQRRKSVEYLPGDDAALVAFRIKTIELFTVSGMMFVNADTLDSLQILQSEFHPNSHMQGPNKSSSGAKESLSVFGLFYHLARTPQGKQKLRQVFLRPSIDLAIIEERQATIKVLLRPDNSPALDNLSKSLVKIQNIRTVVIHLQKGISGTSTRGSAIQRGVWASLQQFTFHTLKILEAVRELRGGNSLAIVDKCREILHPFHLKQIGQWITGIVDFPRSAEQHRTAVKQGVDAELDNMKRTYDGLGDLLSQIATQLANECPEWAQQYIENCIFFPQLGFLTVVPLDPETGKGRYEGEGLENDIWERSFCSDEMGYYKNRRMRETDEFLGDMYGMICDKEIEIIHEMAVKILEYEGLLISASDICGELDSLVALALGAQRYNLVSPQMTIENTVDIKRGRHMLQELTVPSYVANDAFLRGGNGDSPRDPPDDEQGPSLLMMTGPNYSGKSVYLKQIALIVYMAHIGSFVPAESATIGLTDKILTRISTRESVSRTQSAFLIDLQQVALAMTLATRRSLVIIDEFGKGTNSSDGAGLVCGVFENFLSLGNQRPKVLGATHFHEIFENGFLDERLELAFGHMEVRVDDETEVVEDQITYLYNFVSGRSTSSFGTYCAAMSGIDPAVVERAEQLILLSVRGNDLVAACSLLSDEVTRDLEDAEQVARRFLEQDLPPSNGMYHGKEDVKRMLEEILSAPENGPDR